MGSRNECPSSHQSAKHTGRPNGGGISDDRLLESTIAGSWRSSKQGRAVKAREDVAADGLIYQLRIC